VPPGEVLVSAFILRKDDVMGGVMCLNSELI
jgi:hypothetical protein